MYHSQPFGIILKLLMTESGYNLLTSSVKVVLLLNGVFEMLFLSYFSDQCRTRVPPR